MSTIAAGTTSTTALVSTGDTTGKLTFQTNGTTTAMTIDTSQNVGIGVTPTVRFQVRTGTDQQLWVRPGTDLGGANGIGIQSANDAGSASKDLTLYGTAISLLGGNVGIGTSSPVGNLNVYSGSGAAVINIQTPNGGSSGTGLYFRPYQSASDAASNPAQASIVATDSNYSANLIFSTKTPGALGNALTERMRITSDGDVLVGCTSAPSASVVGVRLGKGATQGYGMSSVSGTGSLEHWYYYNPNGLVGTITTSGSATAYNTSSDRRLKQNIAPAGSAQAILDAIQIVQHDWKAGGHTRFGVVAQDLNEVYPEAVAAGDDGDVVEKSWGVDYSKLVPLLVKSIQELKAEVDALKAQLAKV